MKQHKCFKPKTVWLQTAPDKVYSYKDEQEKGANMCLVWKEQNPARGSPE